MADWTATDVAAFIGAGAWLPQIVSWVSARWAIPKLRVIPATTVEIGYTIYGPIVNLSASFFVQSTDALIDKITLDAIHEKGDRRSLVWKWVNETQHQIRSPNGAIAAQVVRNQQAIALRVGLLSQIDRTIGFQDLEFTAMAQELSAKFVTRMNLLREQNGPENFIEPLIGSMEFRELRDAFVDHMYWRDGTYSFEVKVYESRLRSPYAFKFQTELSRADIESLRANCQQLEPACRAAISNPGSHEPTWNWVNREIKRL